MADIATLGLKIDSSQASAASKELDKLTVSGAKAERQAQMLGTSFKTSGVAAKDLLDNTNLSTAARARLTAQLEKQGISTDAVTAAQDKLTTSSGKARDALGRFVKGVGDTNKGLGDAVKGLGGGGSGDGLAPAFEKADGAASRFANTLTRRFILGFAVSQVRGLISAVAGLNTELAQTGYLGRLTGMGSGGFQGLQAVAGANGIDAAALAAGMTAFNQQIPLAKSGIGSLGELLRANRVSVEGTNDAFFKVADLVKNAKDETARLSILQQAGLPATREWANMMGQGSEALKKAIADYPKLTDEQIKEAERLEKRFNELWTNFTRWGKQSLVDVASGANELGDAITRFYLKINPKLADALPKGSIPPLPAVPTIPVTRGGDLAPPKTRDWATEKAKAQDSIAKDQQRISLLGNLATVQDAIRAKENEINLAALNGVSIRKDQVDALKRAAEFQAESSKIARAAQYGIFDSARSASAARLEIQTLIDDKTIRSAKDYADAQVVVAKRLRESADAAAIARAPYEQLTRLAIDAGNTTKQVDQFATGSLGNMENALVSFADSSKTAQQAFSDMVQSILSDLARMVVRMQITLPLAQALNAALTGGGGGFLSMLGIGGGAAPANPGGAPTLSAKGNVFSGPGISAYSNQVITKPTLFAFAKGAGLMGEAGAEAVMPLSRTSDGNLGVRTTGAASALVVNPEFNITVENKTGTPAKASVQRGKSPFDFAIVLEAIDEAMAQKQSEGTGKHAAVLSTQFGVSRKFG